MNAAEKTCYEMCTACFRCSNKFYRCGIGCDGCSGRYDPRNVRVAHPEDACRCGEGVLTYLTKGGKFVKTQYKSNPFKPKVSSIQETQDERDWNAYRKMQAEKMRIEDYDPIMVTGS